MALPNQPKDFHCYADFQSGRLHRRIASEREGAALPNLEHIVIDAASTDGTVEILRRYSSQPGWEYLCWISEPDHGQSDGLNKGFHRVTGDIVGWLNSDDRYRPGCFEQVLDAFDKNQESDIVFGDYTMIDQSGRFLRIRR